MEGNTNHTGMSKYKKIAEFIILIYLFRLFLPIILAGENNKSSDIISLDVLLSVKPRP